jgi:dTDP-4-amino-4,6-dideoxygalactose transaminase
LIPVTKPYVGKEDVELILEVINSGWLTQGPRVAEFEKIVAEYVGVRYGIAVSSCTTALHLSMIVAGVKPGEEVITVSYTFVATANAIIYVGAYPVCVEIDSDTYNIDPTALDQFIHEHYGHENGKLVNKTTRRTLRAIVPVHQFGLPPDLDAIYRIARKYNLTVIEDAAPAIGSAYQDRKAGNTPHMATFSFHPRKVITTGEGGMILTNHDLLADRAKKLRSHSATISDLERHQLKGLAFEKYDEVGYNYRMSDVQAALGLKQMEKLEEIVLKRNRLAQRYAELLGGVEELKLPSIPAYVSRFNYQSYCVRLTSKARLGRDELLMSLLQRGIGAKRGIPPIHQEPYFIMRFGAVSLPKTEEIARTSFLLPLYPQMTHEEQDGVVEALKEALLHG